MNLTVTQVPHGHVHEVFELIRPYILKAVPWTLGRMNADDIAVLVFSPQIQTWVIFDEEDNAIYGYLTTELRQFPQAKHLCVLNCGGEEGTLESCVDKVFVVFEQFARDNGCTGIDIQGRQAWKKFVKEHGYDQPFMHYFKKLEG